MIMTQSQIIFRDPVVRMCYQLSPKLRSNARSVLRIRTRDDSLFHHLPKGVMTLILNRVAYQYEYDSINQILENVAGKKVDPTRAQKYFLMQHGIPRKALEIATGDALEPFQQYVLSVFKSRDQEIKLYDTVDVPTRSFDDLKPEQKRIILINILRTYRNIPSRLSEAEKPQLTPDHPLEKFFEGVITLTFIRFWLRAQYEVIGPNYEAVDKKMHLIPDILKICEALETIKHVGSSLLAISPALFMRCVNLSKIELQSSNLAFLPKEIAKLTKLEALLVGDNPNLTLPNGVPTPTYSHEAITGEVLKALLEAYGSE